MLSLSPPSMQPVSHEACCKTMESGGSASRRHLSCRQEHTYGSFLPLSFLFTDASQPAILWNNFQEHICDDLEHHIHGLGINNPTPDKIYDYGLFLLDKLLQNSGRSLRDWPSMPQVQQDWTGHTKNSLIAEQLSYDCDAEHHELESQLPHHMTRSLPLLMVMRDNCSL